MRYRHNYDVVVKVYIIILLTILYSKVNFWELLHAMSCTYMHVCNSLLHVETQIT